MNTISVLDKGYVRLWSVLGSDLTIVNAARVSYEKRSEKLDERDKRLIEFLAENGHTSPFRHAILQFEIRAPLLVARQWWKYVVGSDHVMDAWNESSRRYVTEEPEFYVPEPHQWRGKPAHSKQGSVAGGVEAILGYEATRELQRTQERAIQVYHGLIEQGIAPEQARLFLPAYAMYVRWWWTASLQSVAHLLKQRMAHDAQWEFQQYAKAVYRLVKPHFPHALKALIGEENGA